MGRRLGRHKVLTIEEDLPTWMETTENYCLYSIAEDVYTAKAWADKYDAGEKRNCAELYRAAGKALVRLNNEKLTVQERSRAGLRADRKFWEAKNCAKRRAKA